MSESSNSPIPLPLGHQDAITTGVVWFDNKSSRKSTAILAILQNKICAINENGERQESAARDIEISSRLGNAPRRLTFPDGTTIVVDDNNAVESLLRKVGVSPSFLHPLESRWRAILFILLLTAALMYIVFFVVLPAMANFAAHQVPPKYINMISENAYQQMLQHEILTPSELPPIAIKQVNRLFAEETKPWQEGEYNYRILMHKFYGSSIPNAFALPDGLIVVTDALVTLLSEDELRAVLLHEIGHVELRHGLQSVISGAGVGLFLTFLGDVSFLLSGSAILLEFKYSRTHEETADCFAYHHLQKRNLNGKLIGQALQKMENALTPPVRVVKQSKEKDTAEEDSEEFWTDIMQTISTHPATENRANLAAFCAS